MFEMTKEELTNWRSQFVSSNAEKMGLRYMLMAFTEHVKPFYPVQSGAWLTGAFFRIELWESITERIADRHNFVRRL